MSGVRPPAPPRIPDGLRSSIADDDVDPEFPDLDGVDLQGGTASFPAARSLGVLRSRVAGTGLDVPADAVVEAHDAELTDVDLTGRRIEALTRVVLRRCRLGGADFGDARLRDVVLDGCVLDLASMRGAELDGVVARGCRTEDLDLAGARLTDVELTDVAFAADTLAGTRLERVDLTGADLTAVVDMRALRGAVVSEAQVVSLARRLARSQGIDVAPGPT